jgi:hypothetical protein
LWQARKGKREKIKITQRRRVEKEKLASEGGRYKRRRERTPLSNQFGGGLNVAFDF